FLNSYPP
ncbi:hypothetical protein TIFTF001_023882, partial [Ficus carica]